MEMPRPAEQHARLTVLAGTWIADETMPPSPWSAETRTATGHVTARRALDGFFVISEYHQEREHRVTYRGHGVYGFDAQRGEYTMHWFDSMGGIPATPATGTWDGDRLVFRQTSPMGHARYVYDFAGRDAYTFTLEHSRDGNAWSTFVTGLFRRVE